MVWVAEFLLRDFELLYRFGPGLKSGLRLRDVCRQAPISKLRSGFWQVSNFNCEHALFFHLPFLSYRAEEQVPADSYLPAFGTGLVAAGPI
jgi:hypothetical protein